jgi:hypothetical protein
MIPEEIAGCSISAVTGTLQYSWLLTALCVLGIFFSPLISWVVGL